RRQAGRIRLDVHDLPLRRAPGSHRTAHQRTPKMARRRPRRRNLPRQPQERHRVIRVLLFATLAITLRTYRLKICLPSPLLCGESVLNPKPDPGDTTMSHNLETLKLCTLETSSQSNAIS